MACFKDGQARGFPPLAATGYCRDKTAGVDFCCPS